MNVEERISEVIEDYNEYYRRRLNEIAEFMGRELLGVAARDELIVDAIRAAATRNDDRDRFKKQKLCDVVSVTRSELEEHNERGMMAVKQAKFQLDHFANGLRIAKDHGARQRETVASLSEEISGLRELVSLNRQQLEETTSDIRYVESLLDSEQGENDRIMCRAAEVVNTTPDKTAAVVGAAGHDMIITRGRARVQDF